MAQQAALSRKFLSKNEVVEALGVSISTVNRALKSGKIPHIKIPGGKTVLIPAKFVENFEARALAGRTSGASL
jgi:excisionase family DNA binding protein